MDDRLAGFVFRVIPYGDDGLPGRLQAEAKRAHQPFGNTLNCLYEPGDHDLWASWGDTEAEALAAVQREVLTRLPFRSGKAPSSPE